MHQQRSQHQPELLGAPGWDPRATRSTVGKHGAGAAPVPMPVPITKPVPIPKPCPVHQDLSMSGSRELPRSLPVVPATHFGSTKPASKGLGSPWPSQRLAFQVFASRLLPSTLPQRGKSPFAAIPPLAGTASKKQGLTHAGIPPLFVASTAHTLPDGHQPFSLSTAVHFGGVPLL